MIAFLPMLLLGIEMAREASVRRRRGGWSLIAIALALSLYAGFPEMSLIDGLVAVIWFGVRCSGLTKAALVAFCRKNLAGVSIGALLAAPIIAAFLGYLPYADTGQHGGGFADVSFPAVALPRTIFPFVYGPLFGFNQYDHSGVLSTLWIEGFLSMSVVALAAVGVLGRKHRVLRLGLAGWIVLAMGKTYGLVPARVLLDVIPGVKDTAFSDYSIVSYEFAFIVLAAFGVDDLIAGSTRKRWAVVALCCTAGIAALEAQRALQFVKGLSGAPNSHVWAYVSIASATFVLLFVILVVVVAPPHRRALPLVAIVLLEAIVLFIVPELSAPRRVTLDTAPVTFLQQHSGLYRFYTLGPIQPNYGSYYSLGSVATNDLPMPKLWVNYIDGALDSNVNPLIFTGTNQLDPSGPTPVDEFLDNFRSYEAVSVKYLVIPNGLAVPDDSPLGPLNIVFEDRLAIIVQLPDPAPFYSTTAAGCVLSGEELGGVTVSCPHPATLTREELFMPGWTATVNGQNVDVQLHDGIVQSIQLPSGTSHVVFSYLPPQEGWAVVAFVVGLVLLITGPGLASRLASARRRRHRNLP